MNDIEETCDLDLQFEKRGGTIPVAVQETSTGQILMLASVNKVAFEYAIKYKIAAFFSTSRNQLWIKGETSGNYLRLDKIMVDCDQDALVYQVRLEKGGVCHTLGRDGRNRKSCFYRSLNTIDNLLEFLEK